MNKGLTLIEVLTALLIFSIVSLVIFGFFQSGYNVFTRGYKDFLVQNDYNQLINYFIKELKNIKEINSLLANELMLSYKKKKTVTYRPARQRVCRLSTLAASNTSRIIGIWNTIRATSMNWRITMMLPLKPRSIPVLSGTKPSPVRNSREIGMIL